MKNCLPIFVSFFIVIAACSGKGPVDPSSPVGPEPVVPSNPDKLDPQPGTSFIRYYFTESYAGLFAGESHAAELRVAGKAYDLSSNGAQVRFTSDNPAVATVDANGKITAVSVGMTKICATDKDNNSAEIYVRVYPQGFIKYFSPTGNKFPIFGYHTDMTEKRDFEVMQDCGFNLAMTVCGVEKNLEILKEIEGMDLKLVPYNIRYCEPEKAVGLFASHPNFGMYYIDDEPAYKVDDPFAAFNRAVQQLDRSHLGYLNLRPLCTIWGKDYVKETYAGLGYEGYLKACLESYNNSFLCFDHYPISKDKDSGKLIVNEEYYDNISAVVKVAGECAVPFWGYTLSIEHMQYPYPEDGHMRMQLFTLLASGAQGFCYFQYSRTPGVPDYKGALYNQETHEKEKAWNAARAINMELQAYAPYLMGAQMLYAMGPDGFSGTNPYDSTMLPAPIKSVTSSNGKFIVSHLCNAGQEYMAVVNSDPSASTVVRIAWEGEIKKIAKDGQLVNANQNENLPAGDILLYKLN